MAERTQIFICYKKILIDEEGQKQRNSEAEFLQYILSQTAEYDAWMDVRLRAGMRWEIEIYSRLLACDVMLVLIGPGTSGSEWVRREIALAKALGIAIVPLGFDLTDQQMEVETKALLLNDLQWTMTTNLHLQQHSALMAEIGESLREAATTTRKQQQVTLSQLWDRRNPRREKAPDLQRATTFRLPPPHSNIALHLASGDLIQIRGVDVFVNSENDYMQMARSFETRTVSSILRSRGSYSRDGQYEDTIQEELNRQLVHRSRPVQASEVFPTSAGRPECDLIRLNKARVLLHVAAVQAVAADARVIPFKQPHQIESAMRSVLAAMAKLNAADGVFSSEGTVQRAEQERLAADGKGRLRSIVFPLLGTGQGGARAADVVGPMLDGLLGYISDEVNSEFAADLRDVYLNAYTVDDVEIVTRLIRARLG